MSPLQVVLAYLTVAVVAVVSFFLVILRRKEKTLGRISILYGPLLVGMVYLTWTVGRVSIGHWPRPNLDDPSNLKAVEGFYFAACVWMLLLPVALALPLVGTVVAGFARDQSWKARAGEGALAYLVLVASVVFLRLDPNHVVDWFMD